jgi:hypothetical protein
MMKLPFFPLINNIKNWGSLTRGFGGDPAVGLVVTQHGSADPRQGLLIDNGVAKPMVGSGGSPSWVMTWVSFFFLEVFFFFLILNLKLRVNWEFYKSFRDVKVISSLLWFDLTPNPNGWGTLQQIQILMGEIEGFWTFGGQFQIEWKFRECCEVSP